ADGALRGLHRRGRSARRPARPERVARLRASGTLEVDPRRLDLMAQLSLFPSAHETVLVDDERGRVVYWPDFVPARPEGGWVVEPRESVPWKTERRRMYDRDVDVPRLQAHFSLVTEE